MKSFSWWQWLCIGLLAAACSLATTGCDDDDDDEEATPTPVVDDDNDDGDDDDGDADDGDNDDGDGDDGDGEVEEEDDDDDPEPHPPIQVPAEPEVLWDSRETLQYRDTREYLGELPADGTVSITASWTAIDLIAGGAPIDSPIQIRVNHSLLADKNSPYGWSGKMSKGEYCEMVMKNNVTDTRATIHVRAVFTPD